MTVIKLDSPALVLRTSNADLRSYWDESFQWPETGHVSAPDWRDSEGCGNGLHGLLWGEGDAGYLTFSPDSKWQVVEINEYVVTSRDCNGNPLKVKYPEGNVLFSGDRAEATKMIFDRAPAGSRIAALTLTGGNRSTLTGGDDSTLTGGYGSTLTGGNRSTLTGGYGSTLLFKWYDYAAGRYRSILAEIGLEGEESVIVAGKPYKAVNGVLVPQWSELG